MGDPDFHHVCICRLLQQQRGQEAAAAQVAEDEEDEVSTFVQRL